MTSYINEEIQRLCADLKVPLDEVLPAINQIRTTYKKGKDALRRKLIGDIMHLFKTKPSANQVID